MVTTELREILQSTARILWILWFAMTAAIWLYVAVAFFIAGSGTRPATPEPMLSWVFAGLAAAMSVASLLLPRLLGSDERLRAALEAPVDLQGLARDPRTGKADPERLQRLERLSAVEQKLLAVPGFVFLPTVLSLALSETVAIFGLVLAFLTRSFDVILPFAIAATVLNLLLRPSLEPVLERASRLVR